MAASLVCFMATLLINLSQQIEFTVAYFGPGRTRPRNEVDVAVASCYLQDNLPTWFTFLFCRIVWQKQRDTSKQRMEVGKEREQARLQRAASAAPRLHFEMQREAKHPREPGRLPEVEEAVQLAETEVQWKETELQHQEAHLQAHEVPLQDQAAASNTRREEVSRQRERASRAREAASRQREQESRQREEASRRREGLVQHERLQRFREARQSDEHHAARARDEAVFHRQRATEQLRGAIPQLEEANNQLMKALRQQHKDYELRWDPTSALRQLRRDFRLIMTRPLGFRDLWRQRWLMTLVNFVDSMLELQASLLPRDARRYAASTWFVNRLQAFIAIQPFACAQAAAFFTFVAGLVLFGVTLIKIGLVPEGAVMIYLITVSKTIGLGPSTFVHFIVVPPDYYD